MYRLLKNQTSTCIATLNYLPNNSLILSVFGQAHTDLFLGHSQNWLELNRNYIRLSFPQTLDVG